MSPRNDRGEGHQECKEENYHTLPLIDTISRSKLITINETRKLERVCGTDHSLPIRYTSQIPLSEDTTTTWTPLCVSAQERCLFTVPHIREGQAPLTFSLDISSQWSGVIQYLPALNSDFLSTWRKYTGSLIKFLGIFGQRNAIRDKLHTHTLTS